MVVINRIVVIVLCVFNSLEKLSQSEILTASAGTEVLELHVWGVVEEAEEVAAGGGGDRRWWWRGRYWRSSHARHGCGWWCGSVGWVLVGKLRGRRIYIEKERKQNVVGILRKKETRKERIGSLGLVIVSIQPLRNAYY